MLYKQCFTLHNLLHIKINHKVKCPGNIRGKPTDRRGQKEQDTNKSAFKATKHYNKSHRTVNLEGTPHLDKKLKSVMLKV